MKITKSTLRRLIKEEMESILTEKEKEPYYGHLGDEKDLRGNVSKYIKEAEKEIQKANLYLKNAKMEGKSLKFIMKMIWGAAMNANEAKHDLIRAWRSSKTMATSKRR
tara:strand:- start:1103 stop:1426 length:324 start_codon:yes stop_codon:yes gene_type:complete